MWSARVSSGFRAVGKDKGDCFVWDFIGDHDEYLRYIVSKTANT
jgi:hypothetical protein